MRRTAILAICLFLLAAAVPRPLPAQPKGLVETKLTAEMEKTELDAKGEKIVRRVPAEKVIPGDTVIYTTSFANVGKEPAENVSISTPIPPHMTYLDGSAFGRGVAVTFSIDGGKVFKTPQDLIVTEKDGKKRPAKPSEYTHILWTLQKSVAPGEKGEVGFRAALK